MEGMTGYVMPLEPPAVGWDIHCHTVFSDGTETPATLAEQSKALGLKGMAISDHDTTAGWPEAEAAAHRVGLPLLRGTEITATDENVSVHMLGYQYDPTNQQAHHGLVRRYSSRTVATHAAHGRIVVS